MYNIGVEIESQKGEDETGWVKVVGKDNVWRERGGRDFYGKIDVIVRCAIQGNETSQGGYL